MSFKTNTSAVNGLVDLKLVNYTTTVNLTTLLADKADATDLADYVTSTALTSTLADYALSASLGTAAGLDVGTAEGDVVVLGEGGKLSSSMLPAMDVVDVSVVADQAALDALTGMTKGDVVVVTEDNKTFIYDGAAWIEIKTPAGSFTGDYNDLINKPTLGTAAAAATTDFATAAQGALADTAVQPAAIADFLVAADLEDYALTATVDGQLALKANAADVYTKTEVDDLIEGIETGPVDVSVGSVAVIAADATLTSTSHIVVVAGNTVAVEVTLDAAPATGKTIIVKDGEGSASEFAITIDGNGKNIDGAATLVVGIDYESVTLVYNGTQWNII